MNIRLKILAIFILTLIIGVGGGYLYYSLITQRIVIGEPESLMYEYHPEPVVIPGVNLSNVNTRKIRRHAMNNDVLAIPDASIILPSEAIIGKIGSSSTSTTSGFGGYSYRKRTIESTNGGGGGAGGGMMAYGGGGRSAGGDVSGGYSSGGTMMGGTSPLMVPKTKNDPPRTGGGIILVDPGTYTTPGEEVGNPIPVGEGWWVLLLLALGYGVIKSPPAIRRRVKSEE